jgi:hypothetical protein
LFGVYVGGEEGDSFDDDVEGGKLVGLMFSGVAIVGTKATGRRKEEMHGPHIYIYPRNLDQ